jgi:hypothetical protein
MSNRAVRSVVLVLLAIVVGTAGVGAVPDPAGAEEPVGALPTAEDFVTQQYEDFLSRAPDAGGLAYWSERLRHGYEPAALVESLALSPEFEGTVAPVVRLYYAHFQRPPDYQGLTHWARVARSGWSIAQISEQFVGSPEFAATYGDLTDEQYVNQVYLNVLGRAADPAGLAYWVAQLQAGMTRGVLMVAFSDSSEYRDLLGGRVLATMLYVGMLRRAPETDGLSYWADVIGDVPYRFVIAGFLAAPEYGTRIEQIYDEVQPLTGVPTRQIALRPALAVKIDNVDAARPQINVERADLIYEEMVEGNLTRLVAIFHSDVPDVVGPVRSVRTTDFDILDQLNTPLLAASGANAGVLAQVAQADLVNVNALVAGSGYFRSSSRSAPHNLLARPPALYAAAQAPGGLPPQLFSYRSPGTEPGGVAASAGVVIQFGRATIDWSWSATERAWVRRQNGTTHRMASDALLAPENVVVLEVPYGASNVDARSPEAHTVGSGTAHVFSAGHRITGTWSRASSEEPIRLLDGEGNDIALTRGQTLVELAPTGSITLR